MTKRDRCMKRDTVENQPLQLRKINQEVDWSLFVGLTVLQHVHKLAELEVLQLTAICDEVGPRGVGDFWTRLRSVSKYQCETPRQ